MSSVGRATVAGTSFLSFPKRVAVVALNNQVQPLSRSQTMKFGAKSFTFFLLASQDVVWSSSAFRPLSFGVSAATGTPKNINTRKSFPEQCLASNSRSCNGFKDALFATLMSSRGGAAASLSTSSNTALNSAVASEETSAAPVEIFRTDYAPLPHAVSKINMDFKINDGTTTVVSELFIDPNSDYSGTSKDLVLDGDETCVKLLGITLNGKDLEQGVGYILEPGKLILKDPPSGSVLKTTVEIVPEDNTQLSGLYKSGPMYCTQCEAMGFRRITYYPDRPDNMAVYQSVRLEANKEDYPILLANGNLVDEGDLEDGKRHFAVWSDPFPKPSYLFCCVAGKMGMIKDSFTTSSGREVALQVFSEEHNVHKLDYAMESLKRSMKWDEDTYGLEYDLDLYNIVAVDSFNMGAMENKVRPWNLRISTSDSRSVTL